MLSFLQGFAFGLWISCIPWLIAALIEPRWAVPTDPPRRWQGVLRYAVIAPGIAMVSGLTSLWGGWDASLFGWLTGLAAIPMEVAVERGWRRWRRARAISDEHAAREAAARRDREARVQHMRERNLRELDPARPPAGADEVVQALCSTKSALLALQRADLAVQADRLYTRYEHVLAVLHAKFDPRELAFQRAQGLVVEVSRAAIARLDGAAGALAGMAGIDVDYVKHRLFASATHLPADERRALERRLELVEQGERAVRDMLSANEAALTALDDAAVAVSGVETGRPQAAQAADEALEELRRFAANAARYSRST